MLNGTIGRSVARALASEYPVGDPFSGPAYANQRWAARLPGHRDFISDIVEGVVDTVSNVVESVAESGIGQLVATAAGFYFGGPLGAALVSGGLSLASGADPLQALLKGGLTYLGGSMLQGAGIGGSAAGATGGAAGEAAGSTIAEGAAGSVMGEAAVADSLASQVAGTTTDPGKFLTASVNPNPGVMSDVSPGLFESATTAAPSAVDSMGVFPGEVAGQWGGATGLPVPGEMTTLQRALQFAKDNKELASGAMIVGGGIINSAMSGVAQNEMLDKRLKAERDLQAQKLSDQQALEAWRRRFTQEGSYGAGTIPFSPAPDQNLRRPDGSLVFAPGQGIVLNAMKG